MTSVHFRPRIQLSTRLTGSEFTQRVQNHIANHDSGDFLVQAKGHHVLVSFVLQRRHFWSPWMHLELRGDHLGENTIYGHFSPHPSIWTGFAFSYLSLGVLCFFSIVLGVSQQLVGQYAWGYWVLLACVLLAALLWFAAQIGQQFAREEMRRMLTLLTHAMETGDNHED